MNKFDVVFSMTAFVDIMDYVQDQFIGYGLELPVRYVNDVVADPMSRFFAYDVTVNHLAKLVMKRDLDTLTYLDNYRGPSYALYPNVVDYISDHPEVRVVDRCVEVPVEWQEIGIVTNDTIPESVKNDPRLVYVHLRYVDYDHVDSETEPLWNRLKHLHVDVLNEGAPTMLSKIASDTLEYFGVMSAAVSYQEYDLRRVPNLKYLKLNKVGVGESPVAVGLSSLRRLLYLDLSEVGAHSADGRGTALFDVIPNGYNLIHLGVDVAMIQSIADVCPNITSLRIDNVVQGRLGSLSQLVYLDYSRGERDVINVPDRDRLRHLKVLHMGHRLGGRYDQQFFSDWNLNETCTILSIRTHEQWPIDDDVGVRDLDVTRFVALKVLMLSYSHFLLDHAESLYDDVYLGISRVPVDVTTDDIHDLDTLGSYYSIGTHHVPAYDVQEMTRILLQEPVVRNHPASYRRINDALDYALDLDDSRRGEYIRPRFIDF